MVLRFIDIVYSIFVLLGIEIRMGEIFLDGNRFQPCSNLVNLKYTFIILHAYGI